MKTQMADAGDLGGVRKLGGGEAVDPVIGLLGDARPGMRDAGEMHHGFGALQQRAPFDRPGEVGHRHDFDRARKDIGRLPHRGADGVAGLGESGRRARARRSPKRR